MHMVCQPVRNAASWCPSASMVSILGAGLQLAGRRLQPTLLPARLQSLREVLGPNAWHGPLLLKEAARHRLSP